MVFKRRERRSLGEIVGRSLYPRGGWGRAFEYVKHRVRRLPDTPEKISRGIWAGVFTTFTPFYGLHFVVAAIIARVMRGNIFAALMATFFGSPPTYIPIAIASLGTGHWMLGRPFNAATFGFGQAAVATGDEALSMLITRTVAFSAVLIMAFLGHQKVKPARAQLPLLIGMGGLETLALGCVSLAGLWPHSEYASVTSSIFGMITVILAWAFLNEPMTRAHWICVSLTFSGVLGLGIMS